MAEIKDAAGVIFDPVIHQTRNGKPLVRKSDGTFVYKRGKGPTPEPEPETKLPPVVETPPPAATSEAVDGATVLGGFGNESFPEVTATPQVTETSTPEASPEPTPETPPPPTPNSTVGENMPPPEEETGPGSDDSGDCLLTAAVIVGTLEGINMASFGPGMAMLPAEKKNITAALEKTLGKLNVKVPPWLELAGAVGVYYFLRLGYISEARKKKEEDRRAAAAKPVNEVPQPEPMPV